MEFQVSLLSFSPSSSLSTKRCILVMSVSRAIWEIPLRVSPRGRLRLLELRCAYRYRRLHVPLSLYYHPKIRPRLLAAFTAARKVKSNGHVTSRRIVSRMSARDKETPVSAKRVNGHEKVSLEVTEEEEAEQTGKNHEHARTVIICETSAWLAEQQPLLR